MKAITIIQPWATLIALGEKKFETRSWTTKYRGPLAIHAGMKWGKWISLRKKRTFVGPIRLSGGKSLTLAGMNMADLLGNCLM
jgi:hypothetical protein